MLVRPGNLITPYRPPIPVAEGEAPVNTEAPVASGTPEVGETLSVTNGTWTGTATITYAYQWRRDAVAINGATSNTYELVSADAETDVDCVVTATNDFGNDSADSNDIAIEAEAPSVDDLTSVTSIAAIVEAQWDATLADSVASTSPQTIANLIASPSSGASQSAYNRTNGLTGDASTDDMTFNGSVGDPAAYLSTDGGDLQKDTGIPTWAEGLYSTSGNSFTYGVAFAAPNDASGTNKQIFYIRAGSRIASLLLNNSDLIFRRFYGSSESNIYTLRASVPNNSINLAIISWDKSTGTFRYACNSRTFTEQESAFNANATATSALALFSNHVGSQFMSAGGRWYGDFLLNGFIGDTELSDIMDYYEALHGRDYTP